MMNQTPLTNSSLENASLPEVTSSAPNESSNFKTAKIGLAEISAYDNQQNLHDTYLEQTVTFRPILLQLLIGVIGCFYLIAITVAIFTLAKIFTLKFNDLISLLAFFGSLTLVSTVLVILLTKVLLTKDAKEDKLDIAPFGNILKEVLKAFSDYKKGS